MGCGAGTVHIQSRRRSFSWVRLRRSVSAYSNSGDQNNASNGQASMQIPQYMHRLKSIANRSSTFRLRSRACSPTDGAVSVCESM